MECTQCGTDNGAQSKFCTKCGAPLAAAHNQTPIWNPLTVTSLSFVFTPIFSSDLQTSNWRSLGQPERAASSKVWFYVKQAYQSEMQIRSGGVFGVKPLLNPA
ncbi:zinc ribbon domain-containing protein [Pararobbsia alpina]|uniref:Zinc-ribbon domain-containing protein n=1 Tax=Pararobbsia alpina TaxID=621374 RepID=A0A6S7D6I5_9BURK|nr:hypothetical protein LMG28138_04243 [Pararobbsia alpina]